MKEEMETHFYERPDEGEYCAICGNLPTSKWHIGPSTKP